MVAPHYTQIEVFENETIVDVAHALIRNAPASCVFKGVELAVDKKMKVADIVRKFNEFRAR